MSLKEHWNIYRDGARDVSKFLEREVGNVAGTLSQEMADSIAQSTLRQAEDLVSTMVTRLLSNIWSSVLEFLMMVLYISFWLANPMPVGNKVEELFRRYILLKGLACAGYGICVGVLLSVLSVDLSAFFGLAAFLLSFVPEVGAFAAILLPMPVILFDSRQDAPGGTLALATGCQLMLKFVFANVVEVKLVEADRLMKMHPVIILLAVTFFGLIWGPTGMLLSVPFVAYLKVIVLSESVPALYRDPVLVVLEGDRGAPAKHARNHRHLEVEASAASSDSNHDGEDGGEDCGGTSAAPPASPRAELRGRRENATPERDRAACAA
ncbi:unnamed protein product [Prorocentrum cordatum]|uniref:AI-2E family transporter n=1 Tax=Prorocentrum cordatum TaxID=2364126 RepID=A0ABN9W5G3_9DINO|nr:unnamed protein product [Polarella glacialis]